MDSTNFINDFAKPRKKHFQISFKIIAIIFFYFLGLIVPFIPLNDTIIYHLPVNVVLSQN